MLENYTNLSPHFLLASFACQRRGSGSRTCCCFRFCLITGETRQTINARSAPAINALAASDEKKLSTGRDD
jgi:hypothetical protein